MGHHVFGTRHNHWQAIMIRCRACENSLHRTFADGNSPWTFQVFQHNTRVVEKYATALHIADWTEQYGARQETWRLPGVPMWVLISP